MEVGHDRLRSNRHGRGGIRTVGLERTWLEYEASDWARKDLVEAEADIVEMEDASMNNRADAVVVRDELCWVCMYVCRAVMSSCLEGGWMARQYSYPCP